MPSYTWEARLNGTTTLTNIQTVNVTLGRSYNTDPFRGSTAVITGRGYTTPPSINVGQYVQLVALNGATEVWSYAFYVVDFAFNYGIVPSEDTWTLTVNDSLGQAGRATVTGSWVSNTQSGSALSNTAALANISIDVYIGATNGTAYLSAQSFTNENCLTILNKIITTEQGYLTGAAFDDLNGRIEWAPRSDNGPFPICEFTDTTPVVSSIANKYNTLEVAGLQGNYATKVIASPSGLAAQSAGTGYKVWEFETYDVSTGQAATTAAAALARLSTATVIPVTLSCITENQTNDAALKACFPFKGINIAFRGSQYTCNVEGGTISSSPMSTTLTYNLTLWPITRFSFTLNSSYYGVLNTSKLG
ncbi:hypothetical protein UFOVP738_4 [uncultured Caudovirales phage]|uniref:Uncharacterized protein n=1 Tax=uncultured Caudovirales phage TaxID=2100421 RepID=A0A6J7X346_9CAUD|nr:hypothetical protein UFOVP738_4 [uncultured Caudovirales phage]